MLALPALLPAQAQSLTLDLVLGETESFTPVLPKVQWIPGTARYSEVREGRTGPYVTTSAAADDSERTHAFAADDLARALRAAGADAKDGELPPFTWLDAERVRVVRGDAVYHWRLGDERAAVRLHLPQDASAVACARDDAAAACVVAADLWISKANGTRRRITWDGRSGDLEYGGAAHRAEFGIQGGLFWDPTGQRLAFYREDLRAIAPYPYIDYGTTPPRAVWGRYPMAGQAHARVTVGVYDVADDSVRFLQHEPDRDLYWTNVTFAPGGGKLFVTLVDRGQDRCELARFDALTGAREAIVLREQDPQWVEPERGPWFEPGGEGRFLWLSPRDGFHHLYRYAGDGQLLGQVTRGAFDVDDALAFAADGKAVFVQASGDDPRRMHLWRADLDGGGMHPLTQGEGTHLATPNHDASAFLVRWSTLASPGGLRVIDGTGALLRDLATATSRLTDFVRPRIAFVDARADDGTLLHGRAAYPPDFDAGKPHPLLLYVYGGPHSQLVTDAWQDGMRELWLQWLATQGCVVASFDGRGTRNRGIEFAQTVHRRLGQLEVADQCAAVRHLLAQGGIEPARVGVHGWSYGGYLTLRLMLLAPDLFPCGAAGAPVTAWEQYETGYTERYMDTPSENPEGYLGSSILPLVGKLRGRLLLVHGSDDRTVMLSHAMSFLDRAVEVGVLVDAMQYPMQRHAFAGAGKAHVLRQLSRFFAEHLLAPRVPATTAGAAK